jgi:hypothetical protein
MNKKEVRRASSYYKKLGLTNSHLQYHLLEDFYNKLNNYKKTNIVRK